MCTLYERIIDLCKKKGVKGGKMCTDLGMSKATLTELKMGRQTGISAAKAQKIASYFGGGGHVKAAGCTMTGAVHDVINNLTEHIEKQLEA